MGDRGTLPAGDDLIAGEAFYVGVRKAILTEQCAPQFYASNALVEIAGREGLGVHGERLLEQLFGANVVFARHVDSTEVG